MASARSTRRRRARIRGRRPSHRSSPGATPATGRGSNPQPAAAGDRRRSTTRRGHGLHRARRRMSPVLVTARPSLVGGQEERTWGSEPGKRIVDEPRRGWTTVHRHGAGQGLPLHPHVLQSRLGRWAGRGRTPDPLNATRGPGTGGGVSSSSRDRAAATSDGQDAPTTECLAVRLLRHDADRPHPVPSPRTGRPRPAPGRAVAALPRGRPRRGPRRARLRPSQARSRARMVGSGPKEASQQWHGCPRQRGEPVQGEDRGQDRRATEADVSAPVIAGCGALAVSSSVPLVSSRRVVSAQAAAAPSPSVTGHRPAGRDQHAPNARRRQTGRQVTMSRP